MACFFLFGSRKMTHSIQVFAGAVSSAKDFVPSSVTSSAQLVRSEFERLTIEQQRAAFVVAAVIVALLLKGLIRSPSGSTERAGKVELPDITDASSSDDLEASKQGSLAEAMERERKAEAERTALAFLAAEAEKKVKIAAKLAEKAEQESIEAQQEQQPESVAPTAASPPTQKTSPSTVGKPRVSAALADASGQAEEEQKVFRSLVAEFRSVIGQADMTKAAAAVAPSAALEGMLPLVGLPPPMAPSAALKGLPPPLVVPEQPPQPHSPAVRQQSRAPVKQDDAPSIGNGLVSWARSLISSAQDSGAADREEEAAWRAKVARGKQDAMNPEKVMRAMATEAPDEVMHDEDALAAALAAVPGAGPPPPSTPSAARSAKPSLSAGAGDATRGEPAASPEREGAAAGSSPRPSKPPAWDPLGQELKGRRPKGADSPKGNGADGSKPPQGGVLVVYAIGQFLRSFK